MGMRSFLKNMLRKPWKIPVPHLVNVPGPTKVRTVRDLPTADDLHEALSMAARSKADMYWRPISGDNTRDLLPIQHQRSLQISHYLWQRNALGKRCSQIRRDLIVSDGFKIESKAQDPKLREKIQNVIDKWWSHDGVRWDKMLVKRVESWGVNGELIFWASPRPKNEQGEIYSGHYRIAHLDPRNVSAVKTSEIDMEEFKSIEFDRPLGMTNHHVNGARTQYQSEIKELQIVGRDPFTGQLAGDVFYLPNNWIPGMARGIPDLLHVSDWIDVVDQLLASETERVKFSRVWNWVCKVMKGGRAAIKKVAARYKTAPRAGTILFTTPNEEWDIKAPALQLAESTEFLRFVVLFVLGGLGIPEHWFVEANTTNKASAAEMKAPIFAWARSQRDVFGQFLKLMVEFRIQEACKAGENGLSTAIPESELAVDVVVADPDRSAFETAGQTLGQIAGAMQMAIDMRAFTQEEAGRSLRMVANMFGLGEFEGPKEVLGPNGLPISSNPAPATGNFARPGDTLDAARRDMDALLNKARPTLAQQFPNRQAA